MIRIHLIYMAAGNSRRFHDNKLLYEFEGKPIYRYGLEVLYEYLNLHQNCTLTVVTQYDTIEKDVKAEITKMMLSDRVQVITNPDSYYGTSYTIKAGINAIEKNTGFLWDEERDYLMFIVADQPWLTLGSVEKLADICYQSDQIETAMLACGERQGNPTLFKGIFAKELKQLTEDEGGRKVMRNHKCVYVQIHDSKELTDIDTREDF